MSFEYTDELDDSDNDEKSNEFHIQESLIFIVDGSKQMHNNDHFKQCLETYRNIVRLKCCFNRKEKMSFIIFGTKESNCDVDNVMVLQEFNTVSVDTLKEIQQIINQDVNKYKELGSDLKYPLFDALGYALQISNSYKNSNVRNIIVLCTCNDNPFLNNYSERRRVEHLVATFKDNNIDLRVLGLADPWDDNIFYKELQIIAGTCNDNNYKRYRIEDFEQIILFPSRSISKVPWKISPNISIEVSLFNLVSAPKYPPKIKLQKENNDVIEVRRVLQRENVEDLQSESSHADKVKARIVDDKCLSYYKEYCGFKVSFTLEEHKKLKHMGLEPSIEILAFKPIMCDPLYHCRSPYFIAPTASNNDEAIAFFTGLVSRCAEKKVMPICRVATRTTGLIAMMIPSEDDGGFYMYKMPFKDNVRDLEFALPNYVFNTENKCPVNDQAMYIFRKLIELTKIDFQIKLFSNPKLEKCIAHVEALALDEKLRPLPRDSTLPPPLTENAKSLSVALMKMLDLRDSESKKRTIVQEKGEKRQKLDIKEIAQNRKLQSLTTADLKEFLKGIGAPTQGVKAVLIKRVYKYYGIEA